MAQYKYTAISPVGGRYLGSALTPPPVKSAHAAYSVKGPIMGSPGQVAIPMRGPALDRGNARKANKGIYSSEDTPNYILPPLYYDRGNDGAGQNYEHAPVSRISDNQMPQPAVRPANILVAAPYQARMGGSRQIYQPQVVPVWLGLRGTPNG